MAGFVDLHLHYVPGVDDGVRTTEEGLRLCRELRALGYEHLVTTPHIRSGMFENDKNGLERAFTAFAREAESSADLPALALSAEHHCDTRFWELFQSGELLPFPGGHAVLIEFANEAFPVRFEQLVFKLGLKRLRPIIAHPERYVPVFKRTDPLDRFLDLDVGLQLDLMSLVGKYGRSARAAAERMLEEGAYVIAASDAHGLEDVPRVARAIETLFKLVGDEEAKLLLSENPRRLLEGKATQ